MADEEKDGMEELLTEELKSGVAEMVTLVMMKMSDAAEVFLTAPIPEAIGILEQFEEFGDKVMEHSEDTKKFNKVFMEVLKAANRFSDELKEIAEKHGIESLAMNTFFDGEDDEK